MSIVLSGLDLDPFSSRTHGDIRYFFPMVLVSFPWIALGFLKIPDWVVRFTSWGCHWTAPRRCSLVIVLAAVVAVLGGFETNLTSAHFMREHVALGKWILHRYGPNRTIVGNIHEMRLVEYYAQGRVIGYLDPRECGGKTLPPIIAVG